MHILKKSLASLLFLAIVNGAVAQRATVREQELQLLADHVFSLSEVMLHDVASPPAASRFYAYALLGAYESALLAKGQLPDINARIKVAPVIKAPAIPKEFNLSLASTYTMLEVGRMIMPSGFLLEARQKDLVRYFKARRKMSDKNIEEHVVYAREIARQVLQYAKADDYNKLSTYRRYTPSKEEGHWYPTPPEYMSAVEPQWKTVRPFFLDSASQFAPAPPAAYDKDSTSSFYKQMLEVYNVGRHLTPEQRKIASFWDCNPFAVTYSGHMAIGLKKISPGGHWMGITGIACKQAKVSLDSAIMIHAVAAMTIHDGFISCWQEKFKSDRIRPEAAINKLIDPAWRPLLQTPPFPEYTSGHSVVSSSAAVILTHFLGDDFEFVDTSEIYFGIPERAFKSFQQAADEAAVSRIYGGIHFRDACEAGVQQGRLVGRLALDKLLLPLPVRQ